jgi:O-antigen/teichoic acid export membrane protein
MSDRAPPSISPPDAPVTPRVGLAGGSFELFIAQIATNIGFFTAVLIIARQLGPAGRGTLAFVTVTALIVGRAASLGIADASAVLAAKKPELRPRLLASVALIASTASLAGATVVALALATLTPPGQPAGIDDLLLVALVGGAVANALMDAVFGFLLGCSRFRHYAAGTALASWGYALLLAVFVVATDLSVHIAAFSWMIAHTIAAVAGLTYAVGTFSIRAPTLVVLRECLAFGVRASVGTLSRFLSFRADQVLMGFLTTEAVLGVYAIAVNASEILLYLPWAAAMAFLPLSASGRLGGASGVVATFRMLLVASLVSVAVAVAVGPPLLPLVFGSEFDASVRPFLLLVPAPLAYSAIWLFSNALLAASRPALASVGPFISLVLGLTLAVILIPIWQAEGAALAATTGYVGGGIIAVAMYRRTHRFPLADLAPRVSDARTLFAIVKRGRPSA